MTSVLCHTKKPIARLVGVVVVVVVIAVVAWHGDVDGATTRVDASCPCCYPASA
jgi:hypothetical protein